MIPYGKHSINDDDVNAVKQVLEQQFLTQGEQVPLFEQALCDYTKARFAVACNSGTSGLHLACLAAGIQPGDTVWTSPNSFSASANCARYCGANVEFIDIDPQTRNLCLSALKAKLAQAKRSHSLPKAIVVVHFAGSACDMKAIAELVDGLNITLIEDAAHGLGGSDRDGNKIGRAAHSDFVVLSFHPVKSMTTAEGGAVLTNNQEFARLVRLYSSHGITRDSNFLPESERDNAWFYSQLALGFNYRLSDIHAALGVSQIRRVDEFIFARYQMAKRYHELLRDLPLILPQLDEQSAWHLYVVELTRHTRSEIFRQLREKGIGVNVHYIPIYRHPYYQKLGFEPHAYPNCERYYENALTLPLFPDMSADMQDRVVQALCEVLV